MTRIRIGLRAARAVAFTELLRTLRDPHVVAYLVAPIALYPMLLWAVFQLQIYEGARLDLQTVRVAVEGPPELVQAFEDAPFERVRGSLAALDTGEVDVAVIGTVHGERWDVTVHHASTRARSRRALARVQPILQDLREWRIGSLIPASAALEPYRVVPVAIHGMERFVQGLIGVLIGYIGVFSMLLSAVYPAIDVVVAERQRGTLETLLLAPVPRWSLLLGKILACAGLTVLAAVGNMASLALTLAHLAASMPAVFPTGLLASPGVLQLLLALPALLATGLLVASVHVAVALLARTFKEAEMLGTLIMFAGILPGFAVVVSVMAGETSGFELLPIGNTILVIQRATIGELGLVAAAVAAVENALLGLAVLGGAGWLARGEPFLIEGRLPGWLAWIRDRASP